MLWSLTIGVWLLAAPAQESMPATAVAAVAGRPPAADASPLQAVIDRAAPNSVVRVPAGTYRGDLIIDRPLTLAGDGRPLLLGSGHGSVIRVRAAGVVIDGLVIDGRGGGSLADDTSGIHISAPRVTVRDCEIRNALFGVYLREADGAVVERSTITGQAGKPAGEQGSGVHVWNTHGYRLTANTVRAARDGFYIQSSSGGVITGNVASDLRYGLHFMSAPDNLFEDNRFERSVAGGALMYSHRLTFRRNAFVANRGFTSVGLLLQGCDDVVAEANLVANNTRGVFMESTARVRFSGNVIAQSDVGVVLYGSSRDVRFDGNAFFGNLTPLELVGRRTDAVFDRNYWAEADEPDLDGDGVRDGEYRLSSLFDHFRGNYVAADLFSRGSTVAALAAAERAFPVLRPVPVVDRHPLARRPVLAGVPAPSSSSGRTGAGGMAMSLASLLAGLATITVGGAGPRRIGRAA